MLDWLSLDIHLSFPWKPEKGTFPHLVETLLYLLVIDPELNIVKDLEMYISGERVRIVVPDDIDLANQHYQTNNHRDGDDRQIDACEF